MKNKRIERKIKILEHEIEYYTKVYKHCKKLDNLIEKLNFLKKSIEIK